MPRDLDQPTRDLLRSIFEVDPNNRITLKEMLEKSFFKDVDWDRIRHKQIDKDEVPYKPNPNKYRYIL